MNQNIPPTGPIHPSGPQGPSPQSGATPAPFSTEGGGSQDPALAAWSQMFGGMATAKELKQFMDLVIKQAIDQIKKDQQRAVEAIRKMRKEQEGE
jgi:hypothetical protein